MSVPGLITGSISLVMVIESTGGSAQADANGNAYGVASATMTAKIDDAENVSLFRGSPVARLEIDGMVLNNWYPSQRFRVTITPIDSGIC